MEAEGDEQGLADHAEVWKTPAADLHSIKRVREVGGNSQEGGREDGATVKFRGLKRGRAEESLADLQTAVDTSWSEPASPPNRGLWRPFLCGADFQSAARFSAPFGLGAFAM